MAAIEIIVILGTSMLTICDDMLLVCKTYNVHVHVTIKIVTYDFSVLLISTILHSGHLYLNTTTFC